MDAFVAGAAIAAQSLGYRGLSELIAEEHLGPEQIARLFGVSPSKVAPDLVVILTAGSIARFKEQPHGWSGAVEEQLARDGLQREARRAEAAYHHRTLLASIPTFEELSARAATFVKGRWPEIERLAAA